MEYGPLYEVPSLVPLHPCGDMLLCRNHDVFCPGSLICSTYPASFNVVSREVQTSMHVLIMFENEQMEDGVATNWCSLLRAVEGV